jgi:lipid II:glycine glycyltransferase (peptidoglycan interpeptide bridge formation enzyme)
MSLPRRRLIRPAPLPAPNGDHDRQVQKLRERLTHERAALTRWQSKLKRAFNSVEKFQMRITRIERQLALLED